MQLALGQFKMALSSGRLVTSIISLLAGKGEPDCSKIKLTVHDALGNIARFHSSPSTEMGKGVIELEKLVLGGHTQKIDKVLLRNFHVVLGIKPDVSKSPVRENLNGFIQRTVVNKED